MNCLYFVFWAQNQLRSGNNTLCQCQPYSSNRLLCCQDNAPLYATWRLNSVIVGTFANSAHGLVTQGFSGHIIRDSWCHGHIRCLAPHAMAIENPQGRDSLQNPYSVCAEPPGEQKWRQPGTWKAQTQRRQAVFQDVTVSTERRYMACFLPECGSGQRSNEDSLLRSSCIYSGSSWERLRWQRERGKQIVYFQDEGSIV